MKVTLITHYYKPIKSPVKRMARIADFLSQKNDVTVITSLPSYPTGILPEEYRGKLFSIEYDKKVKIIRIWDFPTPNKGFFKRALNHMTFVFSSAITSFILEPADLVIVSSPSFFAGLSGIFASLLGKRNFIFDVRDLWPDSAFELGYWTNKPVKYLLKKLEKFFYKRAKIVFCATEEIKKTIVKSGIDENKIYPLVNTINTEVFVPKEVPRKLFNIKEDDFVVIYVGSITQVQNLRTVIDAANILQKHPKIKFILAGEGEDKENMIQYSNKLKVKNVIFMDEQPSDVVVNLINTANIGVISLTKNKFFSDYALPTKTSEYLGCGKPIVACAGINLKELIENNKVGFVVPPGDYKGLSQIILKLSKNESLLKQYSKRARELALKKFSDQNFYKILDEALKSI